MSTWANGHIAQTLKSNLTFQPMGLFIAPAHLFNLSLSFTFTASNWLKGRKDHNIAGSPVFTSILFQIFDPSHCKRIHQSISYVYICIYISYQPYKYPINHILLPSSPPITLLLPTSTTLSCTYSTVLSFIFNSKVSVQRWLLKFSLSW
jgi:hypothetical protein